MKNEIRCSLLVVSMALLLVGCGTKPQEAVTTAMESIQNREYEEAVLALNPFVEEGKADRLVYRALGIAHMGLTEYNKAIAEFEQCLKLSDGFVEDMDYDVSFYLATAYYKNGDAENAAKVLDGILALKPSSKEAYRLRGSAKLSLNDYEGAKQDFNKLLELCDNDTGKYVEVYELFYDQGYKEIGREYLEEALAKDRNNMTEFEIGRMYYYLEEYQEACNYLEEARNEKFPDTYLYLGKAYEACGDYTYAARVYNTFISKDETNAMIYNQLGLCEIARENYTEALKAFEQGIELQDDTYMQTLLLNQIFAYERLGDFDKAKVLMESYLKSYPDDTTAQREYIFLKTR